MRKNQIFPWAPVALAVAGTVAYFMASAYLSMLWLTLVPDSTAVPLLSSVTIQPLGENPETFLWHWHLLAVVSLLVNGMWAARRLRTSSDLTAGLALPMACHAMWLMFAFFLHLAGMLASMVDVVYTIK